MVRNHAYFLAANHNLMRRLTHGGAAILPRLTELITPWRATWYPAVALAGLSVAVLFSVMQWAGGASATGRLGGDFIEFYAAGRIVLTAPSSLYDAAAQREAQKDLMPAGTYIPFAYPPHMALFYAPFARLPFWAAFSLHFFLSAGFLLLAVRLLRDEFPPIRTHLTAAFAIAVFFYPTLRALLGGQNTSLSILLMAAAHVLSTRGRPVAAGLCLGLLLYKPQLGLVLIGLHLLRGDWRTTLSGVGAGAALSLLSVAVFGPDCFGKWLTYATWVVAHSMGMEGEKAVSLIGFFKNIAALAGIGWIGWIGYVLAAATALVLSLAWLRRKDASPADLTGLAAAGAPLIAPHAYFYDAGLFLLTFIPILRHGPRHRIALTTAAWGLGFTQLAAPALGFSPLFFILAAGFAITADMIFCRKTPPAPGSIKPCPAIENDHGD